MLATLTDDACASNWRRANHEHSEQRATCRLCPIGAEHAGEATANLSQLRGTMTCARCHRGAERLIGQHVCVSCKNREYELLKGRNAKGSAPVKASPLCERSLRYFEGGVWREAHRKLTADMDELVVGALRDAQERVTFAFHACEPSVPQRRLF